MANLRRDRGKERYWRRQVAGWRRSGRSVRDYCRAKGLSEPSFYAWRRVLAERAGVRGTDARTGSASSAAAPAFVPVRLIEEADATGSVEVVLRGGRVVRVTADFDAATLRRVLAALEEVASC